MIKRIIELIACKKNIKKRNQWFSSTIAAKLTTKKGASKISRKFLLRGFKIKPKILNFSLINHRFIKAVIKYKQPKKKANIYLFKRPNFLS
jgi:hypothetical protein